MVGVPRSSGCRRCVKRRVKVCAMGTELGDIKYTNTKGSVMKEYRDVPSVRHMANLAQDMIKGSNL